jgi:hypothetical protein
VASATHVIFIFIPLNEINPVFIEKKNEYPHYIAGKGLENKLLFSPICVD